MHSRNPPLLVVAFYFMLGAAASSPAEEPPRRPNVIVIFTDDQGTIDANCFGAKDLHTPGVDLLAARGVRFTQFYAAAPVCSPSRAGLLTGRYPVRAGMPNNAAPPPREDVQQLDDTIGDGAEIAGQVTITEMLREAG